MTPSAGRAQVPRETRSNMPSAITAAFRCVLLAVGTLSVLAIAGCGESPEDTTVKRSDFQAEKLRERLFRVQGAT